MTTNVSIFTLNPTDFERFLPQIDIIRLNDLLQPAT